MIFNIGIKIIKFLCSFVPVKKLRRNIRRKLLNNWSDLTCNIFFSTSLLFDEYTSLNSLIKPDDRILILTPHPDDESIGMGGMLAKYGKQCDVLCVNSSGVKYAWDTLSAEMIADERIREFNNVMSFFNVSNYWIWKIYGNPPHFDKILAHKQEYVDVLDFKKYTIIFTPDENDAHREHQFLTKYLLPMMLKQKKHNQKSLIVYYSVWNTISNPNYFEDISDVIKQKEAGILLYKSRTQNEHNYARRIIGLNYYLGLLSGCIFAESFFVQSIGAYLNKCFDRNWAHK